MKLKVIGWTSYEDNTYPSIKVSYAIKHAVIDDIKENGYFFTGYHHQEFSKCVPVLNNGKRVLFSQRGFGDVIAISQGMTGLYDYSLAAYTVDPYNKMYILPTKDVDESLIQNEKELIEKYTINVDMETYAKADIENILELKDLDEYRFIEKNDIVELVCNNDKSLFYVVDVDRKKDVSYTLEYKFRYRYIDLFKDEKENIIKEYLNSDTKIILKLEYKFI